METSKVAVGIILMALAGMANAKGLEPKDCQRCHKPGNKTVPIDLTTLSEAQIIDALISFRDGTRKGKVMPEMVKVLKDSDIATIADKLGQK